MADPQHRLLLEVVWEALENACEAPERLAGTRTGVFVGLSSVDYAMFHAAMDPYGSLVTPLSTPGAAHCIAANRISHMFDLHGPSLATDTACSSSSYALHFALRSLEQGECDAAIVLWRQHDHDALPDEGFQARADVGKGWPSQML